MNKQILAVILALVTFTQALDLQLTQITKHHSHSQQKVPKTKVKGTEHTLSDTHYVAKVDTDNLVIDTTSFVTWVAGTITQTPITGFPDDSDSFNCEDASKCVASSNTYRHFSFGGRVEEKLTLADYKVSMFNDLAVKHLNFGIASELIAGKENILLNEGVIGLAYGSTHQSYQKQQEAQLKEETPTVKFQYDPSLNIVHLTHVQHTKLVPNPSFALKLEKNLNLFTLGEPQEYFASSEFRLYENAGAENWAVKVSDLQWRSQDVAFKTKLTTVQETDTMSNSISPPREEVPKSVVVGVFDSTTKYMWVTFDIQKAYVREFRDAKKTCADPIQGGVIICDCTAEEEKEFGPLKFHLNAVDHQFIIPSKRYVTLKNNKCIIAIRSFDQAYKSETIMLHSQVPIILSQQFLSQYYTVFDQQKNQLLIADAYEVNPTALHMSDNFRSGMLIFGALLFLGALAALLLTLKQIGYVQPVAQKPVPQTVVYQQQAPVMYQSEQRSPAKYTTSSPWTQGPTQTQIIPAPQYQSQSIQPQTVQTIQNYSLQGQQQSTQLRNTSSINNNYQQPQTQIRGVSPPRQSQGQLRQSIQAQQLGVNANSNVQLGNR